jgi:hypothetical protein
LPSDRNTSTPDQPDHPGSEPARRVDDGVTAHRVANEREPLRFDVIDPCENIVAERREVPFVAADP